MSDVYFSAVPLYAVLVSLAAIPLILFSSRKPNLRESWTLLAGIIKFGLVLSLLPQALLGKSALFQSFEIFPSVSFSLRADPLGVFFALVASGLWILTSVYSMGYMRGMGSHKQTRYFSYFALCLSATIGIAFAGNLMTFILFYEILTIATYPLVIHNETKKAIYAGRKYLAYTLTAGVFLIAAAVWTYHLKGDLEFANGGLLQGLSLTAGTVVPLFFLYLAGVGVKASIMPLHSWLPTAMAAPTPVSALLHAVAVVKSGVFGVIRIVMFVFGPGLMKKFGLDVILMTFAAVTIILGSLMALKQDNLKKRLAYSTVAHLSYIVLGAGLVGSAALVGGLLHIAFHATMKITLFFCAGAIYVNLKRENISDLNGIGKVMPWTMGAFAIGSIGLAGIPPVNGFISKWYLGSGAVESGHVILLIVLVISGILNAAYFFPIVQRAFFRRGRDLKEYGEASPLLVVPLLVTALLSILFGLYPDLFFKFFRLAVEVATGVFGGLG
ncbi:monovalent cation/H+ antiporter subunit D family protein [Acidobacteriota bacterium]